MEEWKLFVLLFDLTPLVGVNGPANLHKPPKPQLCRKCNCCWDGSSVASIFCIMLWMAFNTAWSLDAWRTWLIFWSNNAWLDWVKNGIEGNSQENCNSSIELFNKIKLSATYITGKTFGNTTDPSAKYWYKTRVSLSSLVYLTSVANTVKINACIEVSLMATGSKSTFVSFETDARAPRSYTISDEKKIFHSNCYAIILCG